MAAPTTGKLYGVDAVTADDVWAVGGASASHQVNTLILHWNGQAWSRVPSPSPGSLFNQLSGVSGISASDAWASGYFLDAQRKHHSLLLHWNGRTWSRAAAAGVEMNGVTVAAATNAWAVGAGVNVLHWNGTRWSRQFSRAGAGLYDVAALSRKNAWAVGDLARVGGRTRTFILHWNGTRWSRVTSPNGRGDFNTLTGVAVTSAKSAWAVGCFGANGGCASNRTLMLHWNGSTWKRVSAPHPGTRGNRLAGVSAVSPSAAWAVGAYKSSSDKTTLLRLHWDGTGWSKA